MKVDASRRELWANACNLGRGSGHGRTRSRTPSAARRCSATTSTRAGWCGATTGPDDAAPAVLQRPRPDRAAGDVYISSGSERHLPRGPRRATSWSCSRRAGAVGQRPGPLRGRPEALPRGARARRGRDGPGHAEMGAAGGARRTRTSRASTASTSTATAWSACRTACANGPERVLQAFLDPGGTRVTCVATLDRSHPLYDIPTTGVLVGDDLVLRGHQPARRASRATGGPLPPDRLKENVDPEGPADGALPAAAAAAARRNGRAAAPARGGARGALPHRRRPAARGGATSSSA